jgi:hypothetical protein
MSRQRVSQPPVTPALRDAERHDFWPGFTLALMAGVLLVCGARHVTDLETQEGKSAWEYQLVRAFAKGGLEFAQVGLPPAPTASDDPEEAAAVLDRAARVEASSLKARYRVNTRSATPCPT